MNLVFKSQDKKSYFKANDALNYIHKHYFKVHNQIRDSIQLAGYYSLFNKIDWATELLKPIAFSEVDKAYKLSALIMYLENCLEKDMEGREDEMHFIVQDIFDRLGEKRWCSMFFTPCSMPYSSFYYPVLRTLYCNVCNQNNEKSIAD